MTTLSLLMAKARLALERMRRHSELSSIGFDEVMVFPQGLFSTQALQALDSCGYLAAVNTDLNPSDGSQKLTLRDLLSVAITTPTGFPLFGRHYPKHIADFAFDLFLGKPAFVVEHHGYFQNGYEALGQFVQGLNAFDDTIRWSNLAKACSQASLERVAPDGTVYIRFYSSRFCVTNDSTHRQDYCLLRPQTLERPMPRVTVDGCTWASEQHADALEVRVTVDPGESAYIHVFHEHPTCNISWKSSYGYGAKVFIRRILCELRDNYVDTSLFLRKISAASRLSRKATTNAVGVPALD